MKPLFKQIPIALFLAISATSAFAVPITWTDWQAETSNHSATGELTVDSATVGVSYSGTGTHAFVETGSGTNYWTEGTPKPYTGGTIDNAPTASELVALSIGGTVTINFSKTILDPYIALVSWNSNTVEFGVPISFDSYGCGFWGCGTPVINGGGTGFFGSGEVHGVISLSGAYDSITFTHTSENWHGFTIGVAGLADEGPGPGPGPGPSPAPEPATIGLLALGLAACRKKR